MNILKACNVSALVDDEKRPDDEIFALTRDGFARENPDKLLNGFFAAWPAVLYILAGK